MNPKFKFLVEILSALAILVSLVFLAIEVNQSNMLARATVRQTINDNDVEGEGFLWSGIQRRCKCKHPGRASAIE
jgi:hypothetical protein